MLMLTKTDWTPVPELVQQVRTWRSFRCGDVVRWAQRAYARWLHEIKHDGFRVIARKRDDQHRLYSRAGNDLTYRFPLIVEALAKLRSRSCIIDGEAVACHGDGVPRFDRISLSPNNICIANLRSILSCASLY